MRLTSVGRAAAATLSLVFATSAFAAGSSPAPTPIALGTTAYTQDFDTLASSGGATDALPAGWQIVETGSGGAADGSYIIGSGTNNAGGAYSFGATGSTDRALGSLTSGPVSPITLGAFFTNATGATINSLAISYFGELWRRGSATNDTLSFAYFVGTPTSLSSTGWTDISLLNFVSPGTGSGAVDGDTVRSLISSTISGLSIASGQSFAIRWTDSQLSGSNDGLAVDDFSISAVTAASAVPEAGTWAMMVVGFGALGAMLRRRRPVGAIA